MPKILEGDVRSPFMMQCFTDDGPAKDNCDKWLVCEGDEATDGLDTSG
jgi:hypothetical protein